MENVDPCFNILSTFKTVLKVKVQNILRNYNNQYRKEQLDTFWIALYIVYKFLLSYSFLTTWNVSSALSSCTHK